MGETARNGEALAAGDLAELLAEAAADRAGAGERLAARLRPDLEALLNDRLARDGRMPLAEAGQLVLRHWSDLAGMSGRQAAAGEGASPSDGNPGDPEGGPAGKARALPKSRRRAKGKAPQPAADDAAVPPIGDPLFLRYADEAAGVMQQLVFAALERDGRDGPALAGLHALASLTQLDPPLARVARLRWFAGLGDGHLACALGIPEPEVQRVWLKARAFLASASRAVQTA